MYMDFLLKLLRLNSTVMVSATKGRMRVTVDGRKLPGVRERAFPAKRGGVRREGVSPEKWWWTPEYLEIFFLGGILAGH